MQQYKTRKLAQYYKFTKIELYEMLVKALATPQKIKPNIEIKVSEKPQL